MTKIYIIAGEASGDLLGARLMRALEKVSGEDIQFKAIAGPAMLEAGQKHNLHSLFPMHELSIMGLLEVLPKIFHLKKRIQQTVDDILAWQPDIIVTIDSPGFTLRVIQKLRHRNPVWLSSCRIVHYVAPTVWAWKPKRAAKMAKLVDRLLVLLPFEPPYFTSEGLDTRFVGHSVLEMAQESNLQICEKPASETTGMSLLLLPGSREKEVARLLPVFLQVLDRLQADQLAFQVNLMTLPHLKPLISEIIADNPHHIQVHDQIACKWSLYQQADLALAASGTVSLELALAKTPHIIAYKINHLTYLLVKRMIKVPYVSLVNLLLKRQVLPELLQDRCEQSLITQELKAIWLEKADYQAQLAGLSAAIAMLHPPSGRLPSEEAALAILDQKNPLH